MSLLDAWANPSYCWVVICKNARVHRETNMMFGHKIPLGETDAFEPLPVSEPFVVRCDECGDERSYEPAEVLRLELALPESITPHPQFRYTHFSTQLHVQEITNRSPSFPRPRKKRENLLIAPGFLSVCPTSNREKTTQPCNSGRKRFADCESNKALRRKSPAWWA